MPSSGLSSWIPLEGRGKKSHVEGSLHLGVTLDFVPMTAQANDVNPAHSNLEGTPYYEPPFLSVSRLHFCFRFLQPPP